MDRVTKIIFNEREILIVDYSGCLGDALIATFDEAKKKILTEGKHCVVLNVFNTKTYISPPFMRHIEASLGEVEHLIDKQAIIGLSTIQEWIMKGMNLWYRRQIHSFKTKEQALDYLTK